MKYSRIDNHSPNTLFLFHGTGGTENDFMFFDDLLDKKFNLIGLRGNVNENGMNRFFRRTAPGVFDQLNLRQEAENIKKFVSPFMTEKNVFLGYSNGANIILALIFYFPRFVTNAVLAHPMLPFKPAKDLSLVGLHAFVSYGTQDISISPEESMSVIRTLSSRGASVKEMEYLTGHEFSHAELQDVISYLRNTIMSK